jgi:Helix-turn-helix domain
MKPQTKTVLSFLSRGRTLTALQALQRFGIARLAARIDEIRHAGYAVHTRLVRERGKRFARYRLVSG